MLLTPTTVRIDTGRACGQSHIAAGKTCHMRGAFPTGKAIAAGLTVGAVGATLLHKGSRKAIFNAPGAARRTAQRAVTEVVHRATSKTPSMRLTPKAFEQIKPLSKTERLHLAAQQANKSTERAINRAAQAEVERGIAVGNAMYAAGKATRASLRSGLRTHNLTVEKLRRRYEPGYRKPRRKPRGFGRTDSIWAVGFSRTDAPETGTTDPAIAAQFFKTLLDSVTAAHLLHLQSRSFAQHYALGTFYSKLEELTDGLIEAYQGKYDIVSDYPAGPSLPTNDPISFMTKLSDFVRTTRAAVASDSELQNDIDSIQTLIDSTLYKLTNLR